MLGDAGLEQLETDGGNGSEVEETAFVPSVELVEWVLELRSERGRGSDLTEETEEIEGLGVVWLAAFDVDVCGMGSGERCVHDRELAGSSSIACQADSCAGGMRADGRYRGDVLVAVSVQGRGKFVTCVPRYNLEREQAWHGGGASECSSLEWLDPYILETYLQREDWSA
ncbi:uncharacterized protein EMH_0028840 [Eimeria mitis]|uniref:Uncharacterized protein n=1 Tax=Eimeria mitis TaxID=44415 RepID=U6JU80_9EIME|nr:uncharacterized protein EMH_0028840 [Eimeria mitis]CDJ27083.1 hypothetical protein EMH_0028840 [Eimeria mitis]